MTIESSPLRLEYAEPIDGLRVVRQSPPAGAASFSATYVGPAGWGFDPAAERGVARMVNHLITTAAGRLDRVALARRLDRAGATLSRDTSPEAAEVTLWGPADAWRSLLPVLADVVLRPRFDPEDIARLRRQLFERQLREETQPASRAERELRRAVFPPGHPYRETGLGDRRTVERVDRAALRRFHRAHYVRSGASIVLTTRAPLRSVVEAVREEFEELPRTVPKRLELPTLSDRRATTVRIDLAGRSQVEVRVGGPSIPQSSPDYPAAFLANEALGGRPLLGRLFQRVREQNGLAYHASSHLDTMRLGGSWTAAAGTGPERWKKVVPMLEEEVDRLRRRGVPQGELDSVRTSAIGEMALALESTSDAHELAVEAAYHELPRDYWATWPERLRAVTPADVRRAARRAFDPNRSATVVVGPLRAPRDV